MIIPIAIILCAAAAFGFSTYKARQPYEPGAAFRVPYLAIQFVSVIAMATAAAYLVAAG